MPSLRRIGTTRVLAKAGYLDRASPIDVVVFFALVLVRVADPTIRLLTSSLWSTLERRSRPPLTGRLASSARSRKSSGRCPHGEPAALSFGSPGQRRHGRPSGRGGAALTTARLGIPRSQEEEGGAPRPVPPQGQEEAEARAAGDVRGGGQGRVSATARHYDAAVIRDYPAGP